MFDEAWVRYCVSGTLITCYMACDLIARRYRPGDPLPPVASWARVLILISLAVFYVLIRPAGGALLEGFGNLSGIALAEIAMVLRLTGGIRYPELVARGLFYVALPIAVGVPWGLAVLSLPACAASLHRYVQAVRLRTAAAAQQTPGG
jgi:hypothetical protein